MGIINILKNMAVKKTVEVVEEEVVPTVTCDNCESKEEFKFTCSVCKVPFVENLGQ
jgi:hypothetical protein